MWLNHGSIAVSRMHGVISPDYRVYDLRSDIEPSYAHHVFRSETYRTLYGVLTRGHTTYDRRISKPDFASLPIAIPPGHTQRAIADFLDRKTAAIDALIEKKERLIALLAEQRAALIHRAVTRGLDPDVEMKDSGVEWIGEVPAHWEVNRMRFLCDITTGSRDTQDAEDDGAYPFFVRSQTVERISTWSFDGEAVLTSGDGAGVGKIFHHYVGKLEYHQRVYLFHSFRGVLGRYLYFFLRENFLKVVLAGTAKSTVDSLRRPMLQDFYIAYGPEEEQRKIVEELDAFDAKHHALESKLNDQVERLREYRQALITAAVTGQLDIGAQDAAAQTSLFHAALAAEPATLEYP